MGKPWFSQAGQYSQKLQYWAILGNKFSFKNLKLILVINEGMNGKTDVHIE